MVTNIQIVANLLAGVIWADGEYDNAERITVAEVGEGLEYNAGELEAAVEDALATIKDYSEEQLNGFLKVEADKVDDEEIALVLQAAIQLAVSDGILMLEEVELVHAIADMLGVSPAMTTLFIADMVKHESELEVSFGE